MMIRFLKKAMLLSILATGIMAFSFGDELILRTGSDQISKPTAYDSNMKKNLVPNCKKKVDTSCYKIKSIYSDITKKVLVECPRNFKKILVIGQSNASNSIDFYKDTHNNTFINLNYFNGKCFKSSSPMLGTLGEKYSMWPSFRINSNTIFITASIDNSQLGHWLNQDDLLPYLLNIINNASIDIGKIDEIFIIFGESEINKPNKSYLNRIHTIIEILKEKVANVKIFLSRSTYCKGKYSKSKIDLLTSIDLGENVYLFPNTDELQKKYRYDNCHYNKEGADKVIKLYSDFYNSIN